LITSQGGVAVPDPPQLARYMTTALASAYAAVVLAHADALRAAGVTGKAPPNGAAIEKFVSTITDNALWIIGTVAVLAIVVIGGLFFFGHSRAQDYALKILIGAVVIVAAPGLAA
jgi:type IV secretory pathway VirB2 component (pilin)